MISNNILGGFLLVYDGWMHHHTLAFGVSLGSMLLVDLLRLLLKLLIVV